MTSILSREGDRPQVSEFFFKAVVQSMFLFGEEMWVVAPHIVRVLEVFQDQVAWILTGRLYGVSRTRWRGD